MRTSILTFVCLLIAFCGSGQSVTNSIDSLLRQEALLWGQLANQEITTKEWYEQYVALGHYNDKIQAWYRYSRPMDISNKDYAHLPDSNAILLAIPRNHQVEKSNGNKYIKMYLINRTDSTLHIPRIDATVGQFSTEILLDNQWTEFQTTLRSSCGNSYWQGKLDASYVLALEISNDFLLGGDKPYKIRVVYDHFGTRIISDTMVALLNTNQVARIRYHSEKTD